MIQFQIFNKKENRPATSSEIDEIVNPLDDSQIFFSWHNNANFVTATGIVEVDLDSGVSDDYELRKL